MRPIYDSATFIFGKNMQLNHYRLTSVGSVWSETFASQEVPFNFGSPSLGADVEHHGGSICNCIGCGKVGKSILITSDNSLEKIVLINSSPFF